MNDVNRIKPLAHVFQKCVKWRAPRSVLISITAAFILAVGRGSLADVWYVNQRAVGAETGISWADAFTDLQEALLVAQAGDEIWIAAGTYKPDRGTGDRLATFRLVSGVGVYGGFAGWEECRHERNWVPNETILSGDLNGDDGPLNCEEVSDCCRIHDDIACDEPLCQALVCNDYIYCCDPLIGWKNSICAGIAREACCHLGTWRTCENSHFVVTAVGLGPGTALDGLTVVGSYYSIRRDPYYGYVTGAGIRCDNSSLTIDNCKFQRNYGAGIQGDASSITLQDTSFYDHRPGASVLTNTFPISVSAVRCTFFDNARIFNVRGSATLRDCTFTGNVSAFVAGNATVDSCTFLESNGLQLWDRRSSVTNSRFIRNAFQLQIADAYAVVDNCLFIGSTLGTAGGWGSGLFRNCSFINNSPYFEALGWSFGNLYVLNCTIIGNGTRRCCAGGAGGIEIAEYASGQVLNSIIWGNGGRYNQTREQDQIQVHTGSTLEIDYSIVEGWSGAFGGPGNDGNFGDDPLFADLDGPDDIPGTEDDDVRLSPGSPAINAGLSTSAYLLPTDLDGHSRILCGAVDIGAYEFGIGDFDCNRTVNLSDFAWFPYCLTGPPGPQSGPYGANCNPFDFNADSVIDLLDLAGFQRTLSAP